MQQCNSNPNPNPCAHSPTLTHAARPSCHAGRVSIWILFWEMVAFCAVGIWQFSIYSDSLLYTLLVNSTLLQDTRGLINSSSTFALIGISLDGQPTAAGIAPLRSESGSTYPVARAALSSNDSVRIICAWLATAAHVRGATQPITSESQPVRATFSEVRRGPRSASAMAAPLSTCYASRFERCGAHSSGVAAR